MLYFSGTERCEHHFKKSISDPTTVLSRERSDGYVS